MRRLSLALLGLILALLLALAYALRSQTFVLGALQWAMGTFTDLRLELREPRVDVYRGTLSADEILLLPGASEGPAMLSVTGFSAALSWPWQAVPAGPRTSLRAGSVVIYTSDSDEAADPAPMEWLAYLGWLPDALRIEQVHLVTASANTWIFPLKQLRGDRLDGGRYRLSADADYDGEPLGAIVDLLAVDRGWGETAAELQIDLSAPESGSEFNLAGTLEGTRASFRYEFTLDAAYRDISAFLRGFEGGRDLAGALRLSGVMRGDAAGFVLSDANFVLDNLPDYSFQAGGRLEYSLSGDSVIELVAVGELASMSYLVNWIDLDIGELGRIQSSVKLSGSLDKPVIDAFRLTSRSESGLTVNIDGAFKLYPTEPASDPETNTIHVDINGPSLAVLTPWLGDIPYDLGPWRATATIAGAAETLVVSEGSITISDGDLEARIGPLGATVRLSDDFPLSDLQAPVLATLGDSASLSRYIGVDVPALGRLELRGDLTQKGEIVQLQNLSGDLTGDQLSVRTRGRIGNVAAFSDVSLDTAIHDTDIRTLLAALLPDFDYAGSLGQLAGKFTLADKRGSWRIAGLELVSGDETTPLAFIVSGDVDDLAAVPLANIEARFRSNDPELLEALSGLPLRPVKGSLAVTTAGGQLRSSLQASIGDTELRADGSVTIADREVKNLQLALRTPHLHLQDFGPEAAGDERRGATAPAQASPEPEPFKDPLARLRESAPTFPVDITLDIAGVSGNNSHIDDLLIHLSGNDNRYILEQFSAHYDQALAEIRGVIDLNPTPPAVSLAGQANALPLSAILTDLGVTSNITGRLTVMGGVTVQGATTEEMTRNLNGSVAFALEDAVIEGAAYDLLATDLLAWIYSGALTEKSTHIDCTMAKFQLRQGVAETDSLYIESARMVATGRARFDLVKNRMDLRITPLSKSRKLQVPSEVRVKGDMSNPKADVSAVAAVADATSAAIMLIPNLTMKLFGIGQDKRESYRPCEASLGG